MCLYLLSLFCYTGKRSLPSSAEKTLPSEQRRLHRPTRSMSPVTLLNSGEKRLTITSMWEQVKIPLGSTLFWGVVLYKPSPLRKNKGNLLWPILHLSLEAASCGPAHVFAVVTQTGQCSYRPGCAAPASLALSSSEPRDTASWFSLFLSHHLQHGLSRKVSKKKTASISTWL